ncbi:MAG: aminoacyl-tRNA hydrolase [Caldiserica bacterium]|nr:aminoacyl-tRNA hydrolase [Caldisericota bacterium]
MGSPCCIVGLGNPGKKYEETRHNVGKKLVKWLSRKWDIRTDRRGRTYRFGKGELGRRAVYLCLPSVFMNESGKAVQGIVHRFRLSLDSLLIVHDDADIPFGKIKLVYASTSGGHRGVASIIEDMGSHEFTRLKIGIGREENKDLVEYVLERFTPEEKKLMDEVFLLCEKAIGVWINEGIEKAMSLYSNRRILTC